MNCYLCNKKIPNDEIFNEEIILLGDEWAHAQCQEKAESEARMEK